jgi:hypothetical protein
VKALDQGRNRLKIKKMKRIFYKLPTNEHTGRIRSHDPKAFKREYVTWYRLRLRAYAS